MTTQEPTNFGTTDMGARPPVAPAPDAALRLAQTAPEALRDTRNLTLDGLLTQPGAPLPQVKRYREQFTADLAAGRQRQYEAADALTAHRHEITAGLTSLGSLPALERDVARTAAGLAATQAEADEAHALYRRAGGHGTPSSGKFAAAGRRIRRYWTIPTTIGLDYFLVYAALLSATRSDNFAELIVLAAVSLLVLSTAPHIVGEELHHSSISGEPLNKVRIISLAVVWCAVYGALVTARVIDAQSNVAAGSAASSLTGMGGTTSAAVAHMPTAATIALFGGVMAGASLLTAVVAWRSNAGEETLLVRALARFTTAERNETSAVAAVHAFNETLAHVDTEIAATTRAHELYVDEVLPAQASERAATYFLEATRVVEEDLVPALELRDFTVAPHDVAAALRTHSPVGMRPTLTLAPLPRDSDDVYLDEGAL